MYRIIIPERSRRIAFKQVTKFPKDDRDPLWAKMEKEIQSRAEKKDRSFSAKLKGKWKKFVRKEGSYKIYAVDGAWVRNNLCCYFGHGGHGRVHDFIPLDEIWVSTRHYDESKTGLAFCSCRRKSKNQPVSQNYFDSTAIHEIEECNQMKKGKNYWQAHNIALEKEIAIGLIKNPFHDL